MYVILVLLLLHLKTERSMMRRKEFYFDEPIIYTEIRLS